MANAGEYAFITGKIRVLESYLPRMAEYERMVDAPDMDATMRVLIDTRYATDTDVRDGQSIGYIIDRDFSDTGHMIKKYSPNPFLQQFLFLEIDFHNLGVVLTEKISGKRIDHLLSSLGNWEIDALREVVDAGIIDPFAWKDFPDAIPALEYAVSAVDFSSHEMSRIQSALGQLHYDISKNIAKRIINSDWFIGRIEKIIDRLNCVTALRLHDRGDAAGFDRTVLLSGGTVPASYWENMVRTKTVSMSHFPGSERIAETVRGVFTGNATSADVEHAWRRMILSLQREALLRGYGPQVPYAYFIAKKHIAKNLRLIVNGKRNDVARSDIMRQLLPHV